MASRLGAVDLGSLVCVDDFEIAAAASMAQHDFDYFAGGAETEGTLRANAAAFRDLTLWPRVLRDVSTVDTAVSLPELGLPCLGVPIIAAPVAMLKIAHPEGEPAAAIACGKKGVLYCASQQATTSIEKLSSVREEGIGRWMSEGTRRDDGDRGHTSDGDDVKYEQKSPKARNPPPNMWFQLYIISDRQETEGLVKRAEKCGCAAFVVTVDAPVLGRRERDVRNKFALRKELRLENVVVTGTKKNTGAGSEPGTETQSRRRTTTSTTGTGTTSTTSTQASIAKRVGGRDTSLTWDFIKWIKTVTNKPIIVKGIVRKDDAKLAVKHGVHGVWVSNHGGRQLDGAPATLRALPGVVRGVEEGTRDLLQTKLFSKKKQKRIPIIFDGGVRRGADVVKALALGADLVAVGRPLVWGLACGGEHGVGKVLDIFKEELTTAMALCGVAKIADIKNAKLVARLRRSRL